MDAPTTSKSDGNVDCPHCLSTIPRAAWVCRHCGRDVRLILTLRDQIREELTGAVEKQTSIANTTIVSARGAILAALSVIALFAVAAYRGQLGILTYGLPILAAGVGVRVIVKNHKANLWQILLAGNALAMLAAILFIVTGGVDQGKMGEMVSESVRRMIQSGLAAMVAAAGVLLVRGQVDPQNTSFAAVFERMDASKGRLTIASQFILLISGIITAILAVFRPNP